MKDLNRILLLPDGAEGVLDGDVLDTDLSSVDTSFPLLSEGLYDMVVKSIDRAPNKKGTGENLIIKLATTAEAKSVKNEDLHTGFTLTTYIAISETEKYKESDIDRNLATFQQACGIKGRFSPTSQYVGKVARCKIIIRKAEGEFDEANSIKFVPVE